jgi:hypothetical protein
VKTVEQYAIWLVTSGARDLIDADMNEREEITQKDYRKATRLALDIAEAIEANPQGFMAWYRSIEPVAD